MPTYDVWVRNTILHISRYWAGICCERRVIVTPGTSGLAGRSPFLSLINMFYITYSLGAFLAQNEVCRNYPYLNASYAAQSADMRSYSRMHADCFNGCVKLVSVSHPPLIILIFNFLTLVHYQISDIIVHYTDLLCAWLKLMPAPMLKADIVNTCCKLVNMQLRVRTYHPC